VVSSGLKVSSAKLRTHFDMLELWRSLRQKCLKMSVEDVGIVIQRLPPVGTCIAGARAELFD